MGIFGLQTREEAIQGDSRRDVRAVFGSREFQNLDERPDSADVFGIR